MGLASDLSYHFGRPNAFQRAMQAVGASRPGAWLFARLLPRLDSLIGRASGGRTSLPAVLAGLPVLDLTTTGRRSGRRRTTHLIAVPAGDDLALIGTNFGQPRTPDWVLNLEADPRAEITFKDATCRVVARAADARERTDILAVAAGVYAGYLAYQERITGRTLRVFVLEPAT